MLDKVHNCLFEKQTKSGFSTTVHFQQRQQLFFVIKIYNNNQKEIGFNWILIPNHTRMIVINAKKT